MLWVRVPPEAAHFFKGNVTALGVLCCGFEFHLRQLIFLKETRLPWVCCVALSCCLFDLACFFLPSFSSLIKICVSTAVPRVKQVFTLPSMYMYM